MIPIFSLISEIRQESKITLIIMELKTKVFILSITAHFYTILIFLLL